MQAVHEPPNEEIETVQATAVGATNPEPSTAFVNSVHAQTAANEVDQQGRPISLYGRCIRGFMVGLCLEGVLALCIYGIYHLHQILR